MAALVTIEDPVVHDLAVKTPVVDETIDEAFDSEIDDFVTPASAENLQKLRDLVIDSVKYFEARNSIGARRFCEAFQAFLLQLNHVGEKVPILQPISVEFDFNESTPGNGYRSFLRVVDRAISRCMSLCQKIKAKRSSRLFKKSHYIREIDAWSDVLSALATMLGHLETLRSWSEPGNLYPHDYHSPEDLLLQAEGINQFCFYGRCIAFQFCNTMRKQLMVTNVALAAFSEGYFSDYKSQVAKTACSLLAGSKYYRDPELRAQRIVKVTSAADVGFCKAFWHLADTDFMTQFPGVMCPKVSVNVVFHIPCEPLTLPKSNFENEMIDIPIPTSHLGPGPVQVRLISAKRRVGMTNAGPKKASHRASPNLIFHCHGGGFIACTSAAHEVYLRQWAIDLDCPILSIDYSLAPEAPYPRALEEVFYAYCWVLKNPHIFGSTGEKIIFAGDSAGGNLITACALKCIEMGVRIPDGICAQYTPFLVQFTPSPSRLLCLLDPLIPFGVMMRCLQAYAGHGKGSPLYSKLDEAAKLPLPAPLPEDEPIKRSRSVIKSGSSTKSNRQLYKSQAESKHQSSFTKFRDTYFRKKCPGVPDHTLDDPGFFEDEHEDKAVDFDPRGSTDGGNNMFTFIGDALKKWRRHSSSASDTMDSGNPSPTQTIDETAPPKSPILEFTRFRVARDPHLSPYVASDELLSQLPPMTVITTDLDPCLDDCVMFSKRIHSLGINSKLIILDGDLPHGFLNFAVTSKEALDGMNRCIGAVKELLQN